MTPTGTTRQGTMTRRCDFLSKWAPITTRLLSQGGPRAWNVLDGVFGTMDHVDDDASSCSFVDRINRELETNGMLQTLEPAKTNGDMRLALLLSILGAENSHGDEDPSWMSQSQDATNPSATRRDKSRFISRSDRRSPSFATENPLLAQLIQAIQDTVVHRLGKAMDFDLDLTSVQLAEYPGDGQSGYPRHCDRGPACASSPSQLSQNTESAQRLISTVYYLTPDDWDVEEDGGCLRLYANGAGPSSYDKDEYFDVAPYADRLVIFRSDGVEHQVFPSKKRARRAVTIWLYGRLRRPPDTDRANGLSNVTAPPKMDDETHSSTATTTTTTVPQSTPYPPPLPLPAHIPSSEQQATIFVSIASHRDSETGPTVRNLMQTACFPDRVYVGLVLQIDMPSQTTSFNNDYDKKQVLDRLPVEEQWYASHVRVLLLDARHATGPCPARALCQQLFRGEDYVLQIDSHMRFRKNWDCYILQQLALCSQTSTNGDDKRGNKKVMLSTYPVGYQLPNHVPNETRGTLLLPWKFDDDGMLRLRGRFLTEKSRSPVLCHWYAAGFNFGPSSIVKDVPYDGTLNHLFFGEELSMAVRLYCAGYDLYAPCESVCYHLWSRSHRPPPLQQQHMRDGYNGQWKWQQRQRSMEKVREELVSLVSHTPGTVAGRTAAEFASAVGVCFRTSTIHVPDTATEFRGDDISNANLSEYSTWEIEKSFNNLDTKTKRLILEFLS